MKRPPTMDKTFSYPTARQFVGQKFQVSAGHFLKISSTSAPYVKSRTTQATLDSPTVPCQTAHMTDEKPNWHHPECQGACLACLIEQSVRRDYGTQGLTFLLGKVQAAMTTVAQLSALLYAVERKYPGESRFDTALRYILSVEEQAKAGSTKPQQAND
jgi:hypothetical protein